MKQSWLVWSLLFCLVLVNGLLAVPAVAHADHHAKHDAGTHSTGLCAWQCAAGQSIDTAAVPPLSSLKFIDMVELYQIDPVRTALSAFLFSRGPPRHSR